MSLLGKEIELQGVSARGKNYIRKRGYHWIVLAETDHVLFGPHNQGDWLFITPKGCDQNNQSSRWIKSQGDIDFAVVIL